MLAFSSIRHSSLAISFLFLAFYLPLCQMCAGEDDLEKTFELPSALTESPELYERLEELRSHPVDINTATVEELGKIPWMTPVLAREIVEFRKKNGPFKEPGELVRVEGMSSPALERILPYLKAGRVSAPVRRIYHLRNRVAGDYPGNLCCAGGPLSLYNRATAAIGENITVSALAEKDSYEKNYADLLTFSAEAKDLGPFDRVVAGDYSLDFGQGLVYSSSRFDVKGSGIRRDSQRGVAANRSAVEAGWLRGLGAALPARGAMFYVFGSIVYMDASLDDSGFVKTVYEDGLHRTESEVARINRLEERSLGARAAARVGKLGLGLTLSDGSYRPAFGRRETTYFTFSGDSYRLASADFGLALGKTELFGEAARSLGLGTGCVLGLTHSEGSLDFGVLFRRYDPDFYSPHSRGFSDSEDENEEGVYSEARFKPGRNTTLSGYLDSYRSLGPTYRSPYGSRGRDLRLDIEQKIDRRFKVSCRVHTKREDWSSQEEDAVSEERRGFRVHADYEASKNAGLAIRFENVLASDGRESEAEAGSLLCWEVFHGPTKWLGLRARFLLFETDSWDARIYQYESDLPGVMKNVVVSGRGTRGYLLSTLRPAEWLKLSGKLSWEKKDGETELSAGLQSDVEMEKP